MANILFLGSQSLSRQTLLREAAISFVVVGQSSDEQVCTVNKSFEEILTAIALQKMEQVLLPQGKDGDCCFVLTADTMGKDSVGIIHGKPKNKDDAIAQIKALRGKGLVGTAFCLDKKRWVNGQWEVEERILECVYTTYEFDMPDAWLQPYFEAVPYYKNLSGSVTIQGFGAQFLKSIDGSYTTIIGLPMFELRCALEKIGFYQ